MSNVEESPETPAEEYLKKVFGDKKYVPIPEELRQRMEALKRGEKLPPLTTPVKVVGPQTPPETPDDPELLTKIQLESKNMAEAWDSATSADGRPPIGGAQDD
jgi:hypothetical protein